MPVRCLFDVSSSLLEANLLAPVVSSSAIILSVCVTLIVLTSNFINSLQTLSAFCWNAATRVRVDVQRAAAWLQIQ